MSTISRSLRGLLLGVVGVACDSGSTTPPDPEAKPEPPKVAEFGTAASRRFTTVATQADSLVAPRDLAFDPSQPDQLWVVNQGRQWGDESTVTFYRPGTSQQRRLVRRDVRRAHFMGIVSSIAMGANRTFGTCQEQPQYFMGPTLWPLDTAIYAKFNQGPGGGTHVHGSEPSGGSHLDMLHESPSCMGIAHERDNVFWVFDGMHAAIVRYDFQKDHGPGKDDHSDGIVRRYVDAKVKRVANVPSHLALDRETGSLYVADTGNRRILRLDTRSGRVTGPLPKDEADIREHSRVEGATVEVVVSSGLTEPSGIELATGKLFVSDHATGEIVAYDRSGKELDRIKTPASRIMGLALGPDGKLWYVDHGSNALVRVDP